MSTRQATLEQLRESLRQRAAGGRVSVEAPPRGVSTGMAALDALLPQGGLPRGGLVEWVASGPGSGAWTLALRCARAAARHRQRILVLDPRGDFYPPPPRAGPLKAEWSQWLVLRSPAADLLWASDQILRCPAVAALVGEFPRLPDKDFRRLQLAAGEAGVVGHLIRPRQALREHSWADVRWLVEPRQAPPHVAGRWLNVSLLKVRAGAPSDNRTALLECDDETDVVRLVSPLAHPAARRA